MYFNERVQLQTQATASASFSTQIAFQNFGFGGFQVIWSSLNASNSVVTLDSTIDGVNYNLITSSTVTLSSGSSSQIYRLREIGEAFYVRVSYSAGSSATVGKIDIWGIRKGHV